MTITSLDVETYTACVEVKSDLFNGCSFLDQASLASEEDKELVYESGVDGFLTKP
ncbi:9655_t:CDS:2, partial [Entrophospora sp. SA101]